MEERFLQIERKGESDLWGRSGLVSEKVSVRPVVSFKSQFRLFGVVLCTEEITERLCGSVAAGVAE